MARRRTTTAAHLTGQTDPAPAAARSTIAPPEDTATGGAMLDLTRLNLDQRQAVTTTEGPLLVVAGPGAGKTTVIAARAAYLVQTGRATPEQLLAITFTNRAGRELRARLATVLGDAGERVWAGTFHAFALRLLRRWGDRIGLDRAHLTVYADADDRRAALRRALADLDRDLGGERPDGLLARISRAKSRLERPADTAATDPDLAALYSAYQAVLARRNAIEFDDFLPLALRLLEEHPDVLADLQATYRYLLVDEYQDVALGQHRLLTLVAARSRNLCAVGDPLQNVYSFRGSDIRFLLEFGLDYPEAAVVTLDQSYRATGVLLAVANALGAVLAYGRRRLWTAGPAGTAVVVAPTADPRAEAAFVVAEVRRLLGEGVIRSPIEAAVLYRTNAQARELELACLAAGIPYRVRGDGAVLGRAACRDLLAYLRLAHNPHDTAALGRVINTPPRRLAALARRLRAGEELTLPRLAQEFPCGLRGAAAHRSLGDFLALIEELRALSAGPAAAVLHAVLERTGYRDWLAGAPADHDGADHHDRTGDPVADATGRQTAAEATDGGHHRTGDHAGGAHPSGTRDGDHHFTEDHTERLAPIDLLVELAERSNAPNLAGLLDELSLANDLERGSATEGLLLSTIHGVKGLEFPIVFVTGMEEGLLPHARSLAGGAPDEAVAEELRLCYVAVTRARERLYLTLARRRPGPSGVAPCRPSRFLDALPPDLVEPWRPGAAPTTAGAPRRGR